MVEYDSLFLGGRSFRATWLLSVVSVTLSSVSLSLPPATAGSKDMGPDFLCKGKPMPLSRKELSIKSSSEEWNDSSSPIKWLTMWIPSKGGWPEKPLCPFRHLSCQNKIQVNILNWGKYTHTLTKKANISSLRKMIPWSFSIYRYNSNYQFLSDSCALGNGHWLF